MAQRLGRWMPVVGGVVKPSSWGPGRSLRGAVFLDGKAYDHGAVGVVLTGDHLQARDSQLARQTQHPVAKGAVPSELRKAKAAAACRHP